MLELNDKEVVIAVIGLIGVLVTAILSNWDKLFPKKDEVKAKFSGYEPTGVFETELRIYFEVSGTRAITRNMILQILQNQKIAAIQQNPEDANEINAVFKVIEDERITLDDVIQRLMPVYEKYFSTEELQELNKFYSTEIMQNMLKKMKALTIEAAPLQVEMLEEFQSNIEEAIRAKLLQQQ